MEIINKDLIKEENREKLKERYTNGMPYKHLVIDNFLNEEEARKIFDALKEEKFEYKESDLFSLNQTDDLMHTKNNTLKKFYEFFSSKEFEEWVEKISGIKLKIGKIDMAGSLYKNGDYLLCHDDKLEGRKIAYVYYLSRDFKKEDGGTFVLFDSENGMPWIAREKHIPIWNSLLIFEVGDKSFHEVEEVLSDKKRYAIGGWLH